MTKFEEALAELGRCSWTAMNVIRKSEDWVTKDIIDHMDNCPILEHYKSLAAAATDVKIEWNKIKKQLDGKSLELALEVVKRK